MTTTVCLFVLGLMALIKGGDWFVDSATGIAHRMGIPELLIGATVVSIGTTLPEVMVSVNSAVSGHGEIAYGNAIGSIICNTALIAALTIAIRPSDVDRKSLKAPVLFFFGAAAVYCGSAYLKQGFSRFMGIVFLAIFAVYIVFSTMEAKTALDEAPEETEEEESALWKNMAMLVLSAALIAVGADLLVDNGTLIARALGVSESVIALTMIALGTSLPELVTAITSLIKGHSALSLGNIIGANLFNLVLVSGAAVTLSPFGIPENRIINGYNASLIIDIPVMLGVMAIMAVPALISGKLRRSQGVTLLAIYIGFCIYQFAA